MGIASVVLVGRRTLVPALNDMRTHLSYVLPFRSAGEDDIHELTTYLTWLSGEVEVIVVDGSEAAAFALHRDKWSNHVVHISPNNALHHANGKVNGVITGVALASCERVIVADDDVRYDAQGLSEMARRLDGADLVRPQNYFEPRPWHAVWDTGRSLLNRSFWVDYPGTLGVRRSALLQAGGYDGDVLFENLEMIRTIEAADGVCSSAPGLYVRRLPPGTRRFMTQRIRQAYDDLAQPLRLLTFLAIGPAVIAGVRRRRLWLLAASLCATIGIAERGRRRAGGRRVFPAAASLVAPLWVIERALCVWVALGLRIFRGGVAYGDERIGHSANSTRTIRRRLRTRDRSRP